MTDIPHLSLTLEEFYVFSTIKGLLFLLPLISLVKEDILTTATSHEHSKSKFCYYCSTSEWTNQGCTTKQHMLHLPAYQICD